MKIKEIFDRGLININPEEFKTKKEKIIAIFLFVGVAVGVFAVGYVLINYFHLK